VRPQKQQGLSTTVNDSNRVNIADVSNEIREQAAIDASNNRTFDSSSISAILIIYLKNFLNILISYTSEI